MGGEIIQGYWRVKAAEEDLSSGSAGGSSLDFDTPLEELPGVQWPLSRSKLNYLYMINYIIYILCKIYNMYVYAKIHD